MGRPSSGHGTPLTHHVSRGSTSTLVRVSGELDLVSSPGLRDLIVSACKESPKVLLDLSRVTFVDSSGINALIEAQRQAKASGSWVEVVAASERVRKVLRLAGVAELLGLPARPPED